MTLNHFTVDRHALTWPDTQQITLGNILKRRIIFRTVRQNAPCRLGCQIHQCPDRITGTFASTQLQNLTDKNQRNNHCCRLIISTDHAPRPILLGENIRQKCCNQ